MDELKSFLKDKTFNSAELTVFSLVGSRKIQEEIRSLVGNAGLTIKEDKSILGGYIVKIGDSLFDRSYLAKVNQLEEHLITSSVDVSKDVVGQLSKLTGDFDPKDLVNEVGTVVAIKDGVCVIEGLLQTMYQEVLTFENGVEAIAFNLDVQSVGAIILGDYSKIKVGDSVFRTKRVISVQVGEELLGRVLDPMGNTIDSGPKIALKTYYPVEKQAPGVLDRQPVTQPMQTGIKAIDVLVPIGKGQRELILGDRQTGKTTLAVDTIINQKDSGVISIYVAIGQKMSKVVNLVEKLRSKDALKNTIIVVAGASDPAPLLYLAPYSATAIAEYFADKGKDVLIIYDDLSKHAVAYRELSLLLRRPPGREAFPGDVFFLHSRLLERSVKYSDERGAGSITSLPIIETQAGDISAYIPTNVISITDGQIFLESNLFNKGVRPAINVGLSVSRVGGSAQTKAMKKVAGKIKVALAQYRELEAFSQFAGDLDEATRLQLTRGQKTVEILKQNQYSPLTLAQQILSIYAVNNGYFDNIDPADVRKIEVQLHDYAKLKNLNLLDTLDAGTWSEEVEKDLEILCKDFFVTNGD